MTESCGNIVLFGETGVGKSSIVNMIADAQIAQVAVRGHVSTFQYHSYVLPVHGRNFTIFDTAGIDEGDDGVPRTEAIAGLYKLIIGLNGGINLLMLCMRGPRIKNATHRNWKAFYEILCKKQVPAVLAVTGLENMENMDDWWWDNRDKFEKQGIRPDATACITAIRGRMGPNGNLLHEIHFTASRAKVMTIITDKVLRCAPELEKIEWFSNVTTSYLFGWVRWTTTQEAAEIEKIVDTCGMSEKEAEKFREELRAIKC
ncbi:hypothetical protein K503DRAFT_721067 [Rhizopogon vinicolor AM-OR11-026]|uniref:G domain-containing protein n=1 Tax=Rhizopogon vinicolor AM-OR11-026 TaxID=1314800 RepID=A0A1B7MVK1_9AGAM|nr:hypothetical protein K503DRAFT_721067 [Rhizopogon vinicolor AM-OR11-026]